MLKTSVPIREFLAKWGIYLPKPYPHFVQTLVGSALAAFLVIFLVGFSYATYHTTRAAGHWSKAAFLFTADRLDTLGSFTTRMVYLAADAVKLTSDAIEGSVNMTLTDTLDTTNGLVLSAAKAVTHVSDMVTSSNIPPQEILPKRQESSPHFVQEITPEYLATLGETIAITTSHVLPALPIRKEAPKNVPTPQPLTLEELAKLIPHDAVLECKDSLNPNALPYLESANAPLSDMVKQIDFALLQTILRLQMEDGRILMLGTEARKKDGKQDYLFQRMRFFLPQIPKGDAINSFVNLLQSTLEVWSDRAKSVRVAKGKLILEIDKVVTHEIWMEVVGEEFLLPPEEESPRLTVVIDDMGENLNALQELLNLTIPVTIAVIPTTHHAGETAELAHVSGREVLIHQPMEAMQANAGSGALTLNTPKEKLHEILLDNIKRVPHSSGLNNHMGSRFTQDRDAVAVICDIAAESGLFLLDSVTHGRSVLYDEALHRGLLVYRRKIFLDDGKPTVKSVLAELHSAELAARKDGQAVAIGHPHPETLAALKEWCDSRDTSIQIVPLRHLHVKKEVLK